MKNLSLFNKIVYGFNILIALLTLMAFLLPFLTPKAFPILSVLTLFLPFFLLVNLLFSIYWMVQMKRQFILSGVLLLLGLPYFQRLYQFGESNPEKTENELVMMSFNVRLFNLYQWKKVASVKAMMDSLIKSEQPDLICLQEYSKIDIDIFNQYTHRHLVFFDKKQKSGHAIFSKFPILHKGKISLEGRGSSIIYADVLYKSDTIRLYSMHLKSVNITPDVNEIEDDLNNVTQERSKLMLKRMSESFAMQQKQAELLSSHREKVKHKVFIAGDLNNSAFSYVYRNVRGDLLDAFEEAGEGFGKSYDFKYYPARIDYIFIDPTFEVKSLKTHNKSSFSDHFPLVVRMQKEEK